MLSELHSQDTKQEKTVAEQAVQKMGQRDGEIYKALGYFIIAVGIPVFIGSYWAFQKPPQVETTAVVQQAGDLIRAHVSESLPYHAGIVNVVCSIVLLSIGVASWVYGGVVLKRHE